MKRKQSEYAIIGLVIGIIVGFLLGIFALSQFKKSQREQLSLISIGLFTVGFAAIGYAKGSKIGKEIDKEERTGISKATTALHPYKRGWVAITEWTNDEGTTSKLVTGQADDNELVTMFNDEVIQRHGISSGGKVNVEKFHQAQRNTVFNEIKSRS